MTIMTAETLKVKFYIVNCPTTRIVFFEFFCVIKENSHNNFSFEFEKAQKLTMENLALNDLTEKFP